MRINIKNVKDADGFGLTEFHISFFIEKDFQVFMHYNLTIK